MGCTNCPLDCACDGNYCSGHSGVCTNSYVFVSVAADIDIRALHLAELESAINTERTNATRRCAGTSPACASNCPGTYSFTGSRGTGDEIKAVFYNNVANANNTCGEYHSTAIDPIAAVNIVISAADLVHLQTRINQTRNMCICDTYKVCGADCGCDAECPTFGDPY